MQSLIMDNFVQPIILNYHKQQTPLPLAGGNEMIRHELGAHQPESKTGTQQQMTSSLSSPSKSSSGELSSNLKSENIINNKNMKNIDSSSSNRIGSSTSIESIMANAKLRQEEFARLLEEHEQIVNEINRVETKMSTNQSSLQQQLENHNIKTINSKNNSNNNPKTDTNNDLESSTDLSMKEN